MKILFVCTGNICRSPMAEMIFKDRCPEIEVSSAGLISWSGKEISKYSKAVLESHKISVDFEFKSRTLTLEMLKANDLILTMTKEHKNKIVELYPEFQDKVWLLSSYLGDVEFGEIEDPYGLDYSVYESVYYQLVDLIEKLIKKIGL